MPIDMTNWPIDPANGAFLCSPELPRPKDAKGRWAHTSAREVDNSSDYYANYECKDCGATWSAELPE